MRPPSDDEIPPAKVDLPMTQRKSGLTVPEVYADECRHIEVHKRIPAHVRMAQYVCKDCQEKVQYVVLTFAVVNEEQHKRLIDQMAQLQKKREAEARKKTRKGLVLPGDK